MKVIKKEDRVIYKADEGKKLLFKRNLFSEIVLKHETDKIVEVNE